MINYILGNEVECSICHEMVDQWEAHDLSPSPARKRYVCQHCYELGKRQVEHADYINKKITNAIKEKK